ncbi:MAG: DUF2723 domain-containing protein [Caldilineaceae bacterium]
MSAANRGAGRNKRFILTGALVWLSALVLYASTAGPGIVELFDDSLEFQVVAPTFGIAHPTGYPLYVIAGGLWSRFLFPVGNWAWRMNIFSAVAGASAVLFTYLIAAQLVRRQPETRDVWAGLTASAAFSLGSVWWSQTTIAEVYALHGLLVAAILYVAISLPQRFEDAGLDAGPTRRMVLLFFLIGLSLAHHRMTVLLLPGLAIFLLWSYPSLWRPRTEWLLWFAAFLAPLCLYFWIPWRASQGVADLHGSYVNTFGGFLNHVLARDYAGFLGDNDFSARHGIGDTLSLIVGQLGIAASVLATVGLVGMPLRRGTTVKVWSLLVLVLAANLIFALYYQVPDWQVFMLPALLTLALFAGGGVSIVSSWIGDSTSHTRWTVVAGAGLTAIVVGGFVVRGIYVNRSNDWDAYQYAYLLGSVAYPPESCVVGLEGEITALRYMQVAEGKAANANPVAANQDETRAAAIEGCVSHGMPTYITRELPGIDERYSFSSEGPLVRVWPRGQSQPQPPANPLDMELATGGLRLQGYSGRVLTLPGGPVLELTLGWLPVDSIASDVKVSLRLLNDSGEQVLDSSGAPAVIDEYPLRQVARSHTWLPGELVSDVHYVPLRESADATELLVIIYDAETLSELGRFEYPIR